MAGISIEVSNETDYFNFSAKADSIFNQKFKKYGESWKAFRPYSMTDQILIKVLRLRSLDSGRKNLVKDESIEETLIAIFNYSIIRIMLESGYDDPVKTYNDFRRSIFELYQKKNNDYGEVWKQMRYGSIIDIIYAKLLRVIEAENRNEKINQEEFKDIANYSVFASILQLDL